jgi:hypothetical protein
MKIAGMRAPLPQGLSEARRGKSRFREPVIKAAAKAPFGAAAFITKGYGGLNPHHRIGKNSIFMGKH